MDKFPYSAGKSLPGSNCQTSVIVTLEKCCLKTKWRPNWYAGGARRHCIESKIVVIPPFPASIICIKWEYPKWEK